MCSLKPEIICLSIFLCCRLYCRLFLGGGRGSFFSIQIYITNLFFCPVRGILKDCFIDFQPAVCSPLGKQTSPNCLQTALQNPEGKEMCIYPFLGSHQALRVAHIKSLSARHSAFPGRVIAKAPPYVLS